MFLAQWLRTLASPFHRPDWLVFLLLQQGEIMSMEQPNRHRLADLNRKGRGGQNLRCGHDGDAGRGVTFRTEIARKKKGRQVMTPFGTVKAV